MTSLTYVTVTESFLDGSDTQATGSAVFTPSESVYAWGVPVVSTDSPVTVPIVDGALSVKLLATDNSDLTYLGRTGFFFWTVTVTLNGATQPAWSFFLPSDLTTVDLYSLASTPTPSGGTSTSSVSPFLCAPVSYAPATLTSLVASGTALTAFDATDVNTGPFTAPASGNVLVTASFVAGGTAQSFFAVGLTDHTTSAVVADAVQFEVSSANDIAPVTAQFLATGLVSGSSYTFDLAGAAASGSSWLIRALGTQSPALTSSGAPVVLTVQAA